MTQPIISVIHDFSLAERARTELLAAGFAPEQLELSPVGDEAGPGQSNFTVGDRPAVKGGTDYKDVYQPDGDIHGACVLKALARDEHQHQQALANLERLGLDARLQSPGAG